MVTIEQHLRWAWELAQRRDKEARATERLWPDYAVRLRSAVEVARRVAFRHGFQWGEQGPFRAHEARN